MRSCIAGVAFVVVLLAAACGGSSDNGNGEATGSAPGFPAVEGRTVEQIAADEGIDEQLVASPAGRVFRVGNNRLGFGLFTAGQEPIADADVAIYAGQREDEARGPFPGRIETLATKPQFVADTTGEDPEAVEAVYVSELTLPAKGEWRLIALVRDGDSFRATRLPSVDVGRFQGVPEPGDNAPLIHTPTSEGARDMSEICTRVPPDSMHEVDYADVVGRKPLVLLFATPGLCQSRVCGPVVDVAEQVKSEYDDEDVAFIHMEVYRDNNVAKGERPQLEAFNLPTEPWLFVIDRDRRVSTAIEGGFSVEELRRAVERVVDR